MDVAYIPQQVEVNILFVEVYSMIFDLSSFCLQGEISFQYFSRLSERTVGIELFEVCQWMDLEQKVSVVCNDESSTLLLSS